MFHGKITTHLRLSLKSLLLTDIGATSIDPWDVSPPTLDKLGTKCVWFFPGFVTLILSLQFFIGGRAQPISTGDASGLKGNGCRIRAVATAVR